MELLPLKRMFDRIEIARSDSDSTFFMELLYCGEMITKLVGLGLIAAIENDRNRDKYRHLYSLVRSDGIGEWARTIDEVLVGPTSQNLASGAFTERNELTQKVKQDTWQYMAVEELHRCLKTIDRSCEDLPARIDGKKWFEYFARLRNKTRGHGAILSERSSQLAEYLEISIRIFSENLSLFQRQWAYMHRNLSGKYRVTKLSPEADEFDYLKSTTEYNIPNGVYVFIDKPCLVELIDSSVDAVDFYFPNGGFRAKNFEMLSYITGNILSLPNDSYLLPVEELPASETDGIGLLEIQGNCFGNLPPVPSGYISRISLETELYQHLINDRHPLITLVGRGGIGKTSLALRVLHQVSETDRFSTIVWFSSRDIDLLDSGAKMVKPQILTISEVAKEYFRLIGPEGHSKKDFNPVEHLSKEFTASSIGPTLFVFDNFETVSSPAELYSWIDTYIRLPNKALITTRFRDFKGDYPIDITGMTKPEYIKLVKTTSDKLGISHLITQEYEDELYRDSDGHPYVVKILLGEIAKAGSRRNAERIVAGRDDILDALFERTYSSLTPIAQRIFLTISNWRSTVPQLAIEAVLLRTWTEEKVDVESAVDELSRSSFVEILSSEEDQELFLSIPLAAAIFGKKKLSVSPLKSAVEADTQMIQYFGATQITDVRHGMAPRIKRLFQNISRNISASLVTLGDYMPMLQFIARKYPPAWLGIADLIQENGDESVGTNEKDALFLYLENTTSHELDSVVWDRLTFIFEEQGDWEGLAHSLVERCQLPDVPFYSISNAANKINKLFSSGHLTLDNDEKQILLTRLASVMEERIQEADATDCSRLAWLNVHIHNREKAITIAELGLRLEPSNPYCNNIITRMTEPA
ncbi:NB-ARC domain-containing protein [Alicyclobacillus sp. ALC3]|uniref:NB-ARC domain-containing protein n=1 Tax=Alicyclobacillus sp. ALC3 TaxID=2796143 RepID=UPI002378C843|nr:NB-ARC domain-containing protein [Alicyclobacillus sp. ALC3]WDL98480.1 hypothetical protein JC200_07300 [Alicyclobacillus sp. ALC3]